MMNVKLQFFLSLWNVKIVFPSVNVSICHVEGSMSLCDEHGRTKYQLSYLLLICTFN